MSDLVNPYRIRFDLLNMAKEILEQEYYASVERIERELERNGQRVDTTIDRPSFPKTDQIIALAEQLNAFISRKG